MHISGGGSIVGLLQPGYLVKFLIILMAVFTNYQNNVFKEVRSYERILFISLKNLFIGWIPVILLGSVKQIGLYNMINKVYNIFMKIL